MTTKIPVMKPEDIVKALVFSLWQPWGSLIFCPSGKEYETRGWATSYRGLLVIHAALNRKGMSLVTTEPFNRVLTAGGYDALSLPMGYALGVVTLEDCIRTEKIRPSLSPVERAFGDYSDGRWAWKLTNPQVFAEPQPMRGKQGFWNWNIADVLPVRKPSN